MVLDMSRFPQIHADLHPQYCGAHRSIDAIQNVLTVPPLTAREGSFTDHIAEEMQQKFIKDRKTWECFFLTMFKHLQGFNNKFRCIQHCDTLHLQNSACLCNHFRLTVNIPNKRFLISDFWCVPVQGRMEACHDSLTLENMEIYWYKAIIWKKSICHEQGSHAFRMMKFLDFSRTFPGPNLIFQGPSRTKTTINTHKYSLPSIIVVT